MRYAKYDYQLYNNRFIQTPAKNKKFNQYYCHLKDGMKLRSGKTLNCINNSNVFNDVNKLISSVNMYLREYDDENDYYNDGDRCHIMFLLMECLEKYHIEFITQNSLKKKYYDLQKMIKWAIVHSEHSSHRHCYCDTYYSDDIRENSLLLTDEYNYFISKYQQYSSEYKKCMENYQLYNERYLYRFYKKNFIIFIGGLRRTVAHDFIQITEELKHWYKYFSRSHRSDIKVLQEFLNKNTILNEDCIDLICEFI